MSKKIPVLCVAAGLLCLSSLSVRAEEGSGISYPAKIGGKFLIGMLNVATGIVEIPKTMMTESASEGIAMGASLGLLKGMTNVLGRSFLGMADVVSFPIPTKPLVTPPVVFQDFDKETTYGEGWETY